MALDTKREDKRNGKNAKTAKSEGKAKKLVKKEGNIKDARKDGKKEVAVKKKANLSFFAASRKFLEGVVYELKKVHWPGRRDVVIYTGVVLVAVTLVGAVLWIFDLILSQILIRIL
ncbi:MAG: preprotein translocase subunit SecE [Desulforudis sp.]|jgi:preprotein translocase subunit SecE|nr:preprotein translocase subunit SecE [Clostridia bacterium]RJX21146.1 MAG: preprotein translocase subunit SecE [Desulforudis sp.]